MVSSHSSIPSRVPSAQPKQPHPLRREQGDAAPFAAPAEIDELRHQRLVGVRDRRQHRCHAGTPPALLPLPSADLDEAGFATRGRPHLLVVEAMQQPLGRLPHRDLALVLTVLGELQRPVDPVAQPDPPRRAAVGGVEVEVDGGIPFLIHSPLLVCEPAIRT
jgi:hypothetical protein